MKEKASAMTAKTKFWMYSGSALYAITAAMRVPYSWRFYLLLGMTFVLAYLIDEPIEGRLKKLITVFLFLFLVGTLMSIVLVLLLAVVRKLVP